MKTSQLTAPLLAVALALDAGAQSPEGGAKPKREAAVRHEPAAPRPGEAVLVTAALPAGTTRAVLQIQPVAPGRYIRRTDPEFGAEWIDIPLRDDGREGDARPGDGVYGVRVPGTHQRHRWLIRYRILGTDAAGASTTLPAPDDDCPNFAWWCDQGPATWTGSRDPGTTPPIRFTGDFLGALQPLHLIARDEDVARSQWDGGFHKQRQPGTIVYRGVVHDHIRFTNRGQGSAHISGKNKWGVKFNSGHGLAFLDHDGVPFAESIGSLNLNPGGSTPYLPVLRGIAGLDEVLSMRAYRLAGVPAPPATWIQWRVVTTDDEVSAESQYRGDLWGVYVALGEMSPRLLADPRLPDGLTVSVQSGIKHVPKGMDQEIAQRTWEAFVGGMRANPPETWWRQHLDLPAYFSFHALNRLLGNVDLRPDGNHGYYRHPDGRWAPIPWDNDMMFVPRHHQPGVIEAVHCLEHPAIQLEYRNRAREILDLFAADGSAAGGQVGQLAADLAATLAPPGFPADWSQLDAAVWNQHPRFAQKGSYFVNPVECSHFGGGWTRTLATNDLAGFRNYIVEFCTDSRATGNYAPNDGDQRGYGWGYLAHEARDDTIPATPAVEREGAAGRRFRAAAFASPAGRRPAALEWRVSRVGGPGLYELAEHWKGESAAATTVEIPAEPLGSAGSYRVRARWRDDSGRCGHWSGPVEITVPPSAVGAPAGRGRR